MKHLNKPSRKKSPIAVLAAIVLLLAIVAIVLFCRMKQTKDEIAPEPAMEAAQQLETSSKKEEVSDREELSDQEERSDHEEQSWQEDFVADEGEIPVVFEEEALDRVIADGIEISTPIGSFYYSQVWEDYVEISCSSDDQSFTAVLQAVIGEDRIDILAIHLGEKESGIAIGSAPDSDGNQRKVFLELYEIEVKNSWSQSEIDMIYAMQEGVNQIMEQIKQLYGFVPV